MLVLKCTYPSSSRGYDYVYDGDKEVEAGDLAVVDSPYSGICLVTVKSVRKYSPSDTWLKKVLEVVSFAEKRRREAMEKRRKEIERKLDARAARISKELLYERLAERDPVARDLLEELRTLTV